MKVGVIRQCGWTNDSLGYLWLKDHFDVLTRSNNLLQYCLLLLDGHSSHKTLEFLSNCCQHRMVVLCLPAHTTHKFQPLDVSCFQSLKAYFQQAVENNSRQGVQAIEKFCFIELYYQVRPLAFNKRHIDNAWKDTGLILFNICHLLSQFPDLIGQPVAQTFS